MGGPWEKYQEAPSAETEGPWTKYSARGPSPVGGQVSTPPPDPAEGLGPLDKLLVGAGAATQRAWDATGGALTDALRARTPDERVALTEARKADRDAYEAHHPGGWATAGGIAADIGMGAIPVGAGGQVLTKALGASRYAPLIGDVAANAGYSALTSPENRGTAAALGGAGAAVGRAVGRVATGVVRPTAEAADLLRRGVRLTPGQAAGKDSAINTVEQWATSNPISTIPVTAARRRALDDAGKAGIEDVLGRVFPESKTRPRLTGNLGNMLGQAEDAISHGYDDALKGVSAPLTDVVARVQTAIAAAQQENPLTSVQQIHNLESYFANKLAAVQALGIDTLTGPQLKQIDAELGSYARRLAKSTDAEQSAAARFWRDVQGGYREHILQNVGGETVTGTLKRLNQGYKELLALDKSIDAVGSTFKPRALVKALQDRSGDKTLAELAQFGQNAYAVLPSTIPDSGTTVRTVANALPLTLGVGSLAFGSPVLATGLGAAALLGTSKGAQALTGQTVLQRKLVDAVRSGQMTTAQAQELWARALSQTGRSVATQGQP